MSIKDSKLIMTFRKGGAGSGHFSHSGRPGKRGGSAPGGGGGKGPSEGMQEQINQLSGLTSDELRAAIASDKETQKFIGKDNANWQDLQHEIDAAEKILEGKRQAPASVDQMVIDAYQNSGVSLNTSQQFSSEKAGGAVRVALKIEPNSKGNKPAKQLLRDLKKKYPGTKGLVFSDATSREVSFAVTIPGEYLGSL